MSKLLAVTLVLFAALVHAEMVFAEAIKMHRLKTPPVLDGNGADWKSIPFVIVSLSKTWPDAITVVDKLYIKGGTYANDVYLYLEWSDETKNILHKPWIWNKAKGRYVKGPQREDRLAIQYVMDGDYTTDWFSGKAFKADMWHWKAARTNPLGLMHDKMTIISRQKIIRAAKHKSRSGKYIYIARPSDKGRKIYKARRYHSYQQDLMLKYELQQNAQGSVADVKAVGIWHNGKWHIEIKRQRNTGHDDDVVFPKQGKLVGGIAIFNGSDDDDHAISKILTFEF